MAAYRRIYDSRHLQAEYQEPDQFQNPTLGSRAWVTFLHPLVNQPSPEERTRPLECYAVD